MKKLNYLALILLLLNGLYAFSQKGDFSYFKAVSIKYSQLLDNGKYGNEKTDGIRVLIKRDNTFKTYTIYYVDNKRNKTVVHFATDKRMKFTFIDNSDNSVINDEVPFKNSWNLFMVGNYIIDDKLNDQNKLAILLMGCQDNEPACDYEKTGKVFGRYFFITPEKITKVEFDKLRKS